MRSIALILLLVTTLAGCENPYDKPLPSDIAQWENALKPLEEKLTEEDKDSLARYFRRAAIDQSFRIPSDMTIGKAIDAQRTRDAEMAVKEAEQEAIKKQIDEMLTVTLTKLKLIPMEIHDDVILVQQEVSIDIHNTGAKDISEVTGFITDADTFKIGKIEFKYENLEKGIPAGSTVSWNKHRIVGMFLIEYENMEKAEPGKFNTEFEPETIVFKDGTKLSVTVKK
jgi:hypothetical protein